MATAIQIANNVKYLSPEHKLIRFVAKAYANRNEPKYRVALAKVISDGEVDVAKIRNLFVNRGICTVDEFNSALQSGVQAGVFSQDLKQTGQLCVDANTLIEQKQNPNVIVQDGFFVLNDTLEKTIVSATEE